MSTNCGSMCADALGAGRARRARRADARRAPFSKASKAETKGRSPSRNRIRRSRRSASVVSRSSMAARSVRRAPRRYRRRAARPRHPHSSFGPFVRWAILASTDVPARLGVPAAWRASTLPRRAGSSPCRPAPTNFGRLAIAQPFDIDEQHGFPLRLGKAADFLQHLRSKNIRFYLPLRRPPAPRWRRRSRRHAHATRPQFIEPDGPKNRKATGPAACPAGTARALEGAHASGLNEIVSHVARARQHQGITSQAASDLLPGRRSPLSERSPS